MSHVVVLYLTLNNLYDYLRNKLLPYILSYIITQNVLKY